MKKLLVGAATALLLASCAYTAPAHQVSAKPAANAWAGHPANDNAGPRPY